MNRRCVLITTLVALNFPGCSKLRSNPYDDTYFPTGVDYEWVYERENYIWEYGEIDIKTYDTLHIKVVSKKFSGGWTTFKLSGGSFEDVGEEIVIDGDRVVVFEGIDTIPLVPPDDFKAKESFPGYGVGYKGGTLMVNYDVGGGYVLMLHSTERLKGVGVIRQEAEIREPPHYEGYIDRLLYFIKSEDTVWTA